MREESSAPLRKQKTKNFLTGLAEAFRLLNDVKHSEARKVVYGHANKSSYEIIGLDRPTSKHDANEVELMTICQNIVRSDLNQIGTLIHYDLIDGKIFIEEYYWVILNTWRLLKGDIVKRRKEERRPTYMEHFEKMRTEALEYSKKKYPEVYQEFSTDGSTTTVEDTKQDAK